MRLILIAIIGTGVLAAASGGNGSFDKDVRPVLTATCSGCHNETLASGGLNIGAFLDISSIQTKREGWERIVAKLRAGEMPPAGIPKPSAERMDALLKFVQGEFDRVDRATKPGPGPRHGPPPESQ